MGLLQRLIKEEQKVQDPASASPPREVRLAQASAQLPAAAPSKKKMNMQARQTLKSTFTS
jgi:hypothetical protein